MASKLTKNPNRWWDTGRTMTDARGREFEVSGHSSDAAPFVCIWFERDDDGNEGQVSFHADTAREMGRLLIQIADEADKRPGSPGEKEREADAAFQRDMRMLFNALDRPDGRTATEADHRRAVR